MIEKRTTPNGFQVSVAIEEEILDCGMPNTLAYRLGLVAVKMEEYPKSKIGDEIDRGLVLRRLLEESGFGLIQLQRK